MDIDFDGVGHMRAGAADTSANARVDFLSANLILISS